MSTTQWSTCYWRGSVTKYHLVSPRLALPLIGRNWSNSSRYPPHLPSYLWLKTSLIIRMTSAYLQSIRYVSCSMLLISHLNHPLLSFRLKNYLKYTMTPSLRRSRGWERYTIPLRRCVKFYDLSFLPPQPQLANAVPKKCIQPTAKRQEMSRSQSTAQTASRLIIVDSSAAEAGLKKVHTGEADWCGFYNLLVQDLLI